MNKNRIYFIGIGWFVLSLVSSVLNDIISKYTGMRLHSFQVSFFRFSFGALTLVPFIIYYGANTLKSSNPLVHLARGTLLFFGMTAWTYGLTIAPVSTATVISFAIPLVVLVLAVFFLNENILWQRWVVTIIGFLGIMLTLRPHAQDFDPQVLIFVFAAVSFASLDIINKKFIVQESMISMLFYSAIITAILSIPPAIHYWQTPSSEELALLFVLGASSNLILFLILKAFALVDATAVAPYRYLELLMSASLGYLFFGEIPESSTWYGAAIVIPSTLFIIYSENKAIKKQEQVNK
ncbi:MAG: DMT family transporter [Pseudomonadota bacterium]